MQEFDVVIIGAGAAGLMCAATAGYRDRRVLVIDHANKAGKKILMSGGGRCNFTNLNSTPDNFISANPSFCISALKRYTPQHFLELVERHGIEWCEKAPGQLFCVDSSKQIVEMLMTECDWSGAQVRLKTSVQSVTRSGAGFSLKTSSGEICTASLVIASGGLSIPTMGASPFGYELARQFGLNVLPTRAGLVPFTLQPADKQWLEPLSGVALDVSVSAAGRQFVEPMLVTHRGLSGPAMLQRSSFWEPGEAIEINLLPAQSDPMAALVTARTASPRQTLASWLGAWWPRRFAEQFCQHYGWAEPLQHYGNNALQQIADVLAGWRVKPAGTEGYRTAEVTLGGVDTGGLISKTLMARQVEGLYFVGEVVDVTGELGGHNFQWAWASGWCAGQYA